MNHWRRDGQDSWEDQEWNGQETGWRYRVVQIGCLLLGMMITLGFMVLAALLWEGGAR
jgi:hypothetical protein